MALFLEILMLLRINTHSPSLRKLNHFGKVLGLLVFFLCSGIEAADMPAVRKYDEVRAQSRYDELLAKYGDNKELPAGFELQTLLALSHYPKLKPINIRFVVDDVGIPLSSRPLWSTLLRSARNRTYLVVIDNYLEGPRSVLLLKNQPFNAQIGIIGHELAHTIYYLDRSFFQIVADALCQLSDCRINFERNTDRRLIQHGLGWQRYDHAQFVRRRFTTLNQTVINSQNDGGAYMSPAELLKIIEKNENYTY